MATLQELRAQQAALVATARAKLDEIKDDTLEARAKEIEVEYDKIMKDFDTVEVQAKAAEADEARKETDRKAREARAAQLVEREAAVNRGDPRRPIGQDVVDVTPEQEKAAAEKRKQAFAAYLRFGKSGMSMEQRSALVDGRKFITEGQETRAQGTEIGTEGGVLVPPGFVADVIVAMKMWGPMLDPGVTRMLTTDIGNSLTWPTMDDTANEGSLIGENVLVSDENLAFGAKVIEAFKYKSGVFKVPSELLQDAGVDVEALIREAMAMRIGRVGNRHLTTGDGVSKPNGIVTAAGAGATAASATAIVFDDIFNLEHSVDPAYRTFPSCRYMFNDTTLKALRKLKDGEGRYIWQPYDVRAGVPATISGYPYSINQAMADIATGVRSIVFGAFDRYVVRMVRVFAVRRLTERYADNDQTGFIGFMRLDGDLLDANAVKVLTQA